MNQQANLVVALSVRHAQLREPVHMNTESKSLVRWMPVSISLIILTAVYWAAALVNLSLVRKFQQRGDDRSVRTLLWSIFWDVIVGALFLLGRFLLKRGTKGNYETGACTIAAAFMIIIRTWVSALFTKVNPFPVWEALLTWPWLVYAIVYAYKNSKRQRQAVQAEQLNSSEPPQH